MQVTGDALAVIGNRQDLFGFPKGVLALAQLRLGGEANGDVPCEGDDPAVAVTTGWC